ncbi:MAG TPA: hypothetical protein VL098_00650 [Flavipsychrobacter sp.]|nr:hypothetical protein [Flavipsychrobacter sp.]
MFQLSEHQIDIIYERLRQDKLKSVKLEQDLFDHFCCYMEEQMLKGENFEASYSKAMNAISPNGIKEIEFELYFIMNFNKQLTMKKLIFLSSFISMFLLSTGLMFKTLNWFAANILLFLGFTILFMTMILLVIYATQFLRHQTISFWLRSIAGVTSIALIAIGFIFRALHFSGANIIYGLGTIILNFIFLPLFFYQLYKYGFIKTNSTQTV